VLKTTGRVCWHSVCARASCCTPAHLASCPSYTKELVLPFYSPYMPRAFLFCCCPTPCAAPFMPVTQPSLYPTWAGAGTWAACAGWARRHADWRGLAADRASTLLPLDFAHCLLYAYLQNAFTYALNAFRCLFLQGISASAETVRYGGCRKDKTAIISSISRTAHGRHYVWFGKRRQRKADSAAIALPPWPPAAWASALSLEAFLAPLHCLPAPFAFAY